MPVCGLHGILYITTAFARCLMLFSPKFFCTLFCPAEPIGNIEFAREETPKPKSNVTAWPGSIVCKECCRLASQPNQERSCHSLSISKGVFTGREPDMWSTNKMCSPTCKKFQCSTTSSLHAGVPAPSPLFLRRWNACMQAIQLPEQFYCLTHLPVQQTQIAPAGVILGNLCKCLLLTEDHKCHPLGKTTSHTPHSL